jgi:hypothetical protein
MKLLLSLLCCFTFLSPPDMLVWRKDYRVLWSDFKAPVPARAANAALTSYNTTLKIDYTSETGFTYEIRCEFDRNRSWVRVRNDEVLAHERGHFDIGEIFARKLRARLSYFQYRPGRSSAALNLVYDSVMKACGNMQELYDAETDFSRNRSGQQQWDTRIPRMLDSLATWSRHRYNNPASAQ